MINKIDTIVVDFDGTAYNTIEVIVDLYNEDFSAYSDYKKVDWSEIETWDFTELKCASREYINTYFNQPRFFNTIQPMPYFNEVIDRLKDKFHIVFCSCGYSPNLKLKKEFLKEHYPYAEFIGINLKDYDDKSHVNMKNALFLDDSIRNLTSSNASIKVLFGDDYEWNKGWRGLRCYNWYDVIRSIPRWIDF